MFINCPFCRALVATDPATDLPPDHCPRCAAKLRGLETEASGPAMSTASGAGGATAVPRLDPDLLLQVPPPGMPLPDSGSGATPSELSSRIHRIVAMESPGAASGQAPAIGPIATMLKRAGDEPTSPVETDEAAGNASASAAETKPASPSTKALAPTPAPGSAGTTAAAAAPANPAPPAAASAVAALDTPTECAGTNSDEAVPPVDPGIAAASARARPPAMVRAGAATDAGRAAPASMAAAIPAIAPAGATTIDGQAPVADMPASPSAARASAPSFTYRHARVGATGFDWKTLAAIAALALLLALQLLLADRAQLAADARWRPLLANVCGVLGCALPPWREPAAFTVLARGVRPHPTHPGALRVSATFRNDARWAQPWPRLRLTLSDVNGNTVAARDFSARDYLGAAPAQADLHSGQSASIAMDIVEPEARSVAFDFELH